MRRRTCLACLVLASIPLPAAADDPGPVADIVVTRRLDAARQQIEPALGATETLFGRDALDAVAQGDGAPLNQVLLRAPGVAQDSFGQVHLRGEHANIQYRIDGVQLPEGLSVFGQAVESRLADSLSLLTGALPAQYGFNTAGVVDIRTKSGATDPGAAVSIYGGGIGWVQPSFDLGGRAGPVDWFATGDYLRDDRGIENPAATRDAVHDRTEQLHGLAYLSDTLDEDTRVSLVLGAFRGDFEIPDNPGQAPSLGLTVDGVSRVPSESLDERQRETTDFAVLSLQKHAGAADAQLSAFTRYSGLYFSPDKLGDLLFDGVAQTAARSDLAGGAQADASWRTGGAHTVRAGFLIQAERAGFATDSLVLPTDAAGAQTSEAPLAVHDSGGRTGGLYGAYLQDEWRVLPSVTINYGARFDVIDQYTHEAQLSPRVNVVWQAAQSVSVHAGYARYFQAPPFELVSADSVALFRNTTAAASVRQDDAVRAERSNYYDIGLSRTAPAGFVVGLDGYFKQARNLLDEGQFGAPIILSAFNYDRSQTVGAELNAAFDHGPWSLYGNLAYSRAIGREIVSAQFNFQPDELAYIARRYIHLDHDQRWTGSAGASYAIGRGGARAALLSADMIVQSGLRTSAQTVPNGASLKTYGVVNLSVVRTLDLGAGRGTQIRLDVLNVGDTVYEIRDGSGVGVGAPQYGLRRTFLAGVTQRF